MKRLYFRLVPFLIALILIIGSITLFSLYLYRGYEQNKVRFVNNYFNYEKEDTVSTIDQIENFIKFESSYYQLIDTNLNYYDAKSKNAYSSNPSNSSYNLINGATYENGVLHLPGYFDIKLYAESVYNSDMDEWTLAYYFFIYNVNYRYQNLVDHLYVSFVDGIGEYDPDVELKGTTKLELVLDEIKQAENGTANSINLPQYNYSSTKNTVASNKMYIYDNDCTNYLGEERTNYVYRLTTMRETNSERSDLDNDNGSKWFYELESLTFSIFYSGNETVGYELPNMVELVRGNFTRSYDTPTDFNAACGQNGIEEGYAKDLNKAGYVKYITPRVIISDAILFVVVAIIAFLFYLIWQDPEDAKLKEEKKQINKNKITNNKQKDK